MSAHGVLSESSVSYRVVTHDRKGREGKGREIGEWLRSIHDLKVGAMARLMDGGYAETGGR